MDHCCEEAKAALLSLKTAKGQIDGIMRMLDEDRYCVDISKQIMAAIAMLKKANFIILRNHMNTCVKDAVRSEEPEAGTEKINEIMTILQKYLE